MENTTLNEITEIAQAMLEVYPSIRKQKAVLNTMSEYVKEGFKVMVQKIEDESGEDIKQMEFDGVTIRYSKVNSYQYNSEFKNELLNLGLLHLVVTEPGGIESRFDLSEFRIEDSETKPWLGNSMRRNPYEKMEEEEMIESAMGMWDEIKYSDLVEQYMNFKNSTELQVKESYDVLKEKLLKLMIENNISKVEKFSLNSPKKKLDFANLMFAGPFEENLLVATNGKQIVDILGEKFEFREDFTLHEMKNVVEVKKGFGAKKKEILTNMLGKDYYFMEGTRTEKNILLRMDVSHTKVEKLVDEGYMLANEVFGRELVSTGVTVEIIDEYSDRLRKEMYFNKISDKKVRNSLIMEEELRERRAMLEELVMP